MFSKSLLTSLSLSFVSVLPNFKIEYKFIVRIGKAEGIYQNHSSSEQQNKTRHSQINIYFLKV